MQSNQLRTQNSFKSNNYISSSNNQQDVSTLQYEPITTVRETDSLNDEDPIVIKNQMEEEEEEKDSRGENEMAQFTQNENFNLEDSFSNT